MKVHETSNDQRLRDTGACARARRRPIVVPVGKELAVIAESSDIGVVTDRAIDQAPRALGHVARVDDCCAGQLRGGPCSRRRLGPGGSSALTAWGDGNAVITWTGYHNDPQGSTNISEPIEAAVSHDAGATWTAPSVISGAASFCAQSRFTAPTNPPSCDQSNFSVPVVAADGSMHVAFETNGSNSTFRGVYAEIQLDPTTGRQIAGRSR